MIKGIRRNFHVLRRLMDEYYLEQVDIAKAINKSHSYVTSRFVCAQPWTLTDMYAISDYFKQLTDGEIDISKDFASYFPHPDEWHNSREMIRKLREGA